MEYLFQVRKDLHRIPEPALQEIKTTSYILDFLQGLSGIKIHTFDFPGVLVEYSHGKEDYMMFRADMDGLPIEEKTGCDFSSEHPGFMHACGHDVHMTVLLGLVDYVTKKKPDKNLLFLFQPAEEKHGGAERIIATGILNQYPIKEAYALHVFPDYPVGTIASNSGVLMGIPQEFDLVFKGLSSHASHPHKGRDSIASACLFQQTLPENVKNALPPEVRYISHVGKMYGGAARNIVADEVTLEGTLRALDKNTMETLKNLTIETAKEAASVYKTEPEISFPSTYDPVVNSSRLFEKLQKVLPKDLRLEKAVPVLGGEDFGFFTTLYEGLMLWVGTGKPEIDLHSPFFLPGEEAVTNGLRTFIALLEHDL